MRRLPPQIAIKDASRRHPCKAVPASRKNAFRHVPDNIQDTDQAFKKAVVVQARTVQKCRIASNAAVKVRRGVIQTP
jgi:hypothetical protein